VGRGGQLRHPDLGDGHRHLGFRFEHTDLTLFANSPPSYLLYVKEFGDSPNSFIVSLGWHVTRATTSSILRAGCCRWPESRWDAIADLSYYKANYLAQWFAPVYGDSVLMLRGDVGYAAGYSGKSLPFYKVFYAGGVGSVRGYETASLGPRDIYGIRWGAAQDRRQCGAVLSDPEGGQVGAREHFRGRRADLRRS